MENVLTLSTEDLVNSNTLQINVNDDGMASAVGMPINVVPAEGSYVLKQLEDGTTVLLDAMTFLNHMGGQLVLSNTAPVGTDLLAHSIFSASDPADPGGTQLIQSMEPTEEVAMEVSPPPPPPQESQEPQMTSVEVLLAQAPDLGGPQEPGPPPPPPPPPRRRVPRLYPLEPDQEPPGPAPWRCPTCGKMLSVWKRYLNHVKLHDYDKPFKCDQCPESFNFQKNWELHRLTHNTEELQCPDCDRLFRRAASLRAHLAVHQVDEAIVCHQCQMDFPTQVLLDKHLPVHTTLPLDEERQPAPAFVGHHRAGRGPGPGPGPDPLETEFIVFKPSDAINMCGQCKLVFDTSDELKEHEHAHQAVQSLLKVKRRRRRTKHSTQSSRTRCGVCHKSFAKPGLLTRHMMIHTGEKPFKCQLCDRAFNQKNALKIHTESKHGKLKPHSCQLCRLTFAQKGNLRNHVRRVHNLSEASLRPHKCPHCGCGFTTQGVLGSHISKMHERPSGGGDIGTDALKDLVKQLLDYSAANEEARDRIQAQIADMARAGVMGEDQLPAVLSEMTGAAVGGGTGGAAEPEAGPGSGTEPQLEPGEDAGRDDQAAAVQAVQQVTDPPQPQVEVEQQPQAELQQQQQQQQQAQPEPEPQSQSQSQPQPEAQLQSQSQPEAQPQSQSQPEAQSQSQSQLEAQPQSQSQPEAQLQSGPEPEPATGVGVAAVESASLLSAVHDPTPAAPAAEPPPPPHSNSTSNSTSTSSCNSTDTSSSRKRPAIITVVDKLGWTGDNLDGDAGKHVGRKYLVRVRYEGCLRWFQCLFCSKEFRKPYDLVRHLRIHTKDRPFRCSQCVRSFTVRSGLESHLRVHRGIKLASCPICDKKFATASVLKVHLRVHTGVKPYSCQYCQKPFRTMGNKNTHEESHRIGDLDEQGNDIRAERRKAANTSYVDVQLEPPIRITDQGDLVQEHKTRRLQATDGPESQERPHRCSVCSVAFKKVSHMRQHMRQHTGERPHRCNLCNKSFITASALTNHERTHTGARFYKCPICNSAFTTGSSLKRHMSTHTEDRPYMCPYCHRRFKTRMICKKHTRTHKMELARGLGSIRPPPPAPPQASRPEQGRTLFPTLIAPDEEQLLSAGLADGAYTTRAQNVNVILDEHGQMVQCELAPGEVQTLTADADGTVTIGDLAQERPAAQTGLGHLETTLSQPLFPASELAASLNRVKEKLPAEEALMMANIAAISRPPDEAVQEEAAMDHRAAAVHTEVDSDDDEALRLRNEQDGRMILEMDSDNVLLQDPSLSQPLIHRCGFCKKMFNTQLALATHEEIHVAQGHHLDQPAAAAAASEMEPGLPAGQPADAHLCSQCLTVFSTEEQLTSHRATHEPPPPPPPPPPQPARSPSTAAAPAAAVQGSPPSVQDPAASSADQCPQCGAAFLNAAALKKHTAREHGRGKRKNKPVIRLSEKLTARLAEQPLSSGRSQAEICLIQSAVEKVQNGPVPRAEPEEATDSQLKHRCHVCSKGFRKPSDLARHTRIHTGEKPFSCELCHKSFTVKSTLLGHLRTHSGQRDFQCLVCKASFGTKCALRVHSRLHTGARPYQCAVCDRWFRTSGHRNIHMSTHGGRPHRRASQQAARDQSLPLQLQGMLDELTAETTGRRRKPGTLGCQAAGEPPPPQQPQPQQQEQEQTEDDPAAPQPAPQQQQLEPVSVSADGGGPVLQLEPALAQQLQLVLSTEQPGAAAPTADTELRVQVQIDSEGRIVGLEALQPGAGAEPAPPPPVEEPAEAAARPSVEQARTLRQVVAGAIQQGGIPCSVCTRVFQGQSQWRRHMRGHGVDVQPTAAGRSGHTCTICQAVFNSASLLARHTRTHTGERPFQCDQCDRAFSQKNTLRIHMRTHLGDRPHACPFCGHRFAQKGNMRTHIRRTHLKTAIDTLELDARAEEAEGAA